MLYEYENQSESVSKKCYENDDNDDSIYDIKMNNGEIKSNPYSICELRG